MSTNDMTVTRINGLIGAEIGNVDIASDLDDRVIAQITDTVARHGVVFFRDQDLSPERQLAFSNRFSLTGGPNENPMSLSQITMIEKEEQQLKNVGGGWHADQTFNPVPSWGSILAAKVLPSAGGDTAFATLAAAYDDLSPGLQAQLETMRAVHDNTRVITAMSQLPQYANANPKFVRAAHPAVIRHPLTGRKSLFVNRGYTTHFEGWTVEESAPLLQYLFQRCERPEYQVRLKWRPGTVAFWDNLQVLHYAVNDYHGERRLMQRTSVAGIALDEAGCTAAANTALAA
ncbi:TauD/TfdA dioxygenase family protein [Sphingomonas sp. MMS24-J13]|uniref:TauD/TfdA dioxygenase family protein n=1 Tax=Sphingomonas sp. MMS24-J13 TaxID=3238686 RepID=UPI00384C31A1